MPAWLLAVPALMVVQAPAPTPALDQLQGLMMAIPEALVDGKRTATPGLVVKAKSSWDALKPEVGKALPEAELTFIDKQLKAMLKMKPREQAAGALGISSALSRYQPRSRKQDLLQANRTVMLAWCGVDGALWEPMPRVEVAFKPLIEQDNGQHALAVVSIQEAIKRFQESTKKRKAVEAKKALKELLNLSAVLEKA